MEKRLILAVALSVVIYAVFMWFMAPPPRPVPSQAQEPTQQPLPSSEPQPLEATLPATSEAVDAETEETTEVDGGVFHAVWTNRGARAKSWSLTAYGAAAS